jgi:thiol-disulfide isomerase/thioredoxin
MMLRIAHMLIIAMVCFPAQAGELYAWHRVLPPKQVSDAAVELVGAPTPTRLHAFRGKPVVLNFWATWCPPCIDELPTLAALQERHAKDGLVVLAVSIDTAHDLGTIEGFLQKNQIAHPRLAHDKEGVLFRPLRGAGLPVTYLMNREGALVYKYEGATDWLGAEHQPYIREILQDN